MTMDSLRYFGTIAFGGLFMREHIFFGSLVRHPVTGDPVRMPSGDLQLGVWMQFVPESYRPGVTAIVGEIGPDFLRKKVSDAMLHAFIGRLQSEIFARLEPVFPGETAILYPKIVTRVELP